MKVTMQIPQQHKQNSSQNPSQDTSTKAQETPRAARLGYDEIRQGAIYMFERTITLQDMQDFARLSGDFNPLHMDPAFAKTTPFANNVMHGMLAASLFSTLVGMHCPGQDALYLQQTLHFRQPLFPGDRVKVKGTVTQKNDAVRIITLKTEIFRIEGGIPAAAAAITGEAKVQVRE